MKKLKLNQNGVLGFSRMAPFTPGRANLNPPKRIGRLQELLNSKTPKICVVRGEGIGDVIMTTPTIKALYALFKGNVSITYATNTKYLDGALMEVLRYNPDIAQVIDRDHVDEADFDCVINLHCPAIAYEKPGNPPINRVDLFARHAGLVLEDPRPYYFVQRSELDAGSSFIASLGLSHKKIMVVNIFASSNKRTLDQDKVKEVIKKMYTDHQVNTILLRHSSDASSNIEWSQVPGLTIADDLSIRELGGLLPHCNLVLCPDSAILHLSGALSVPTVGVFTSTHPAARINYYTNTIAVWGGAEIQQCPCWYGACPNNYVCAKMLTADQIVEACVSHMKNAKTVDLDNLAKGVRPPIIRTEVL